VAVDPDMAPGWSDLAAAAIAVGHSVPAHGRGSGGFIRHAVKKTGSPHRARDRVRGFGRRALGDPERATSPERPQRRTSRPK